ncbi:MAG: HD-GYP domain-containing protein [Thermoguttaceae bacterium]
MLIADEVAAQGQLPLATAPQPDACDGSASLLERAFGTPFLIVEGASGETLAPLPGEPARNWPPLGELCREVARRGKPEFIRDDEPLLTLALPWTTPQQNDRVAVATFITRSLNESDDVYDMAEQLGIKPRELEAWAQRQTPRTPEALIRASDVVLDDLRTRAALAAARREAESLSANLASTYEEISLLYRLTQNLKISQSDEDLARVALEWLQEVVPAAGLAIGLTPIAVAGKPSVRNTRSEPALLTSGDCQLDVEQFTALMHHLGVDNDHRPVVVNRPASCRPDWPCAGVRQVIAVSLAEGENTFGWLAALNHADDGEFGTVEATLLSSVAAILGIHGGNIELYRQQSALLAGIVRALSSAIDAKDPYTCGHSDRVARVAVRLAEEMGCDAETANTLYLAGLLHDIGKIGIDDGVLRKTDRLSPEEYEHIKRHVEIGHHILEDLSKLEEVLPVVLHHHESWSGDGYPDRLSSEEIPLSARIVAVADAFDAMSSNRPYRKAMPAAQVDEILRAGAGRQWDPQVVNAYFRSCDEIRRMYET